MTDTPRPAMTMREIREALGHNTTDDFVPPAAMGLPAGTLEAAEIGADRLDAWARTPHGRNFLAHALVQLARTGWLRTEPGEPFEPMREDEITVEPAAPSTLYPSRAAEAELYVLLRKAGEGRYEAQALIDRHRDEVLRRMADETATTYETATGHLATCHTVEGATPDPNCPCTAAEESR
jgi:hypothetical protein